MFRKLLFQTVVVLMILAMVIGCGGTTPEPAAPTEAPAAPEPTAPPETEPSGEVKGTFYWVQNTAWHPVHQLTQLSFMEGCEDLGLDCELATTDEGSLEALLAVAEQAIDRPEAKGVAMWAGGLPVVAPLIEKAKEKGMGVALPHFPVPEGSFADNAVQIAADTTKYPVPVAEAMCEQLEGQTGSVAVTQNNFNATENMVAKVFTESMNEICPEITVLAPEEEGPEPTQAIAKAVSIMQANPDLIGALSTTGGGPTTWAGAQKETGKEIVAIGMDYTRVNLDLVDSGQVFAVVGQPLYAESKGSAELLYKMANGEEVPYWTVLEAPLITKADLAPWYELLDRMEDKMRPTPAPEAPAEEPGVKGTFYWVQNTAWHPVHQLTQLSFMEGCEDLGLDCELATTDEGSLEALLAVAEQAIDRPEAKGVAMWAGGLPVVAPLIEKAKEKGIGVALPHFPVPEGSFADNAVQIAADTTKYPVPVAEAMCEQLEGQTGSVAVTQNNFNATENMVAKVFTESMNEICPEITVLAPEEEGPEPTQAIAKAVSIMQANPDLIGALSTTGGGPTTWAGAQKETGKEIVAIGMDYTRVNLDLVDSGQVFAVVGQPLYAESKGSAELLYKMANGEEVPYWTVLEAPLITKADLAPWYELLDWMEGNMRPTPAPEAPAEEPGVKGTFYWVQNTAWHPVHQLTQLSFMEGCEELGLDCELATTDEGSLEALLAVAEQAIDRPEAKGVAMWAGGLPVVAPLIEKAKEKGIGVALPHFPVPEGSFADNAVQIAADTTKYPVPVAEAMCEQLEGQTGSVAVTQNNFNATENMVAKVFTESMNEICPEITVLAPEEEGPEPTQAIAKAVSIMQANPDLIGALSTTGGGPTTWAGAQKETGKEIVAIGMDYTRVNLDLVDSGQVYAVVGQPLYAESKGSAELLYKMANGEEVPYWTVLEAPLITKADLAPWYELLDRMEGNMRPTPTP